MELFVESLGAQVFSGRLQFCFDVGRVITTLASERLKALGSVSSMTLWP